GAATPFGLELNLVNPNCLGAANVSLQQGLALIASLFLGLSVGCRRAPTQVSNERAAPALPGASAPVVPSVPASLVATVPSAATPSALPPLSANWLEPLPLADGNLAYVTPPVGARQ